MERYTMFLDWMNQHCENDYTTIPIRLPMVFFTELEQFHNLYGNKKDPE